MGIRKRLLTFFHSNRFHYILAGLIVLDLAIVLTDIILLLLYCDDMPDGVEDVIEDLVYASLTILGLFIIELSLQVYAYGPKEWCSHPLQVLDFVIVIAAFVLEAYFHAESERVE